MERFLPNLTALRHYDRAWLRGDVLAGVTVAAYLIPQVMAYAEIVRLPAVVGLWAILPALLVYAVLGSSRQLSVGPESSTALMTAAGVGALVTAVGTQAYAEVAALIAIAVGIVCIVGWVARLGFLANLLSKPVLVGYMVGIALLMIASQLGKVTGIDASGSTPAATTWSVITQLNHAHVPTVVLSLVVLTLLFVGRAVAPTWPTPLIVVVAAAAVVHFAGLTSYGIVTLGAIPEGLPAPHLPHLDSVQVWSLLPYALGIAVVGYSDNVLTGRAFAAKRDEHIDAGQELLALGAANVVTGLFQGFPVSSSSSRTVIGDAMGSRTQLHSLVAAAAVVLTLLFAGPVLSSFASASLGALVIYAATRLIDISAIRKLAAFRRSELVLSLVTAASVVAFDVLIGIGIAVALSLLDLIRRLSTPHDGVLGYVPGVAGMHDVNDYPDAVQVPGLVVYRYDSPLFFANADNFYRRALAAVDEATPPVHWFVLNAEANVQIDLTVVDTLHHLADALHSRHIVFALTRVKFEIKESLEKAGLIAEIGADRVYATLPTAVGAYAAWHRDEFGTLPAGLPQGLHVPDPD